MFVQEMSERFISENFIVVTREVLNEVILKFRIFFSGYKNLKEVKKSILQNQQLFISKASKSVGKKKKLYQELK